MVTVHFLSESECPGVTGKYMLQYMLLLTETKESCAHVLLMTAWLLDRSTSINCVICKPKQSMPSNSQSQLQVTHKVTR